MSSTSLELQPLELFSGDLLRPLGAFEELFCLFDQRFPTNGALAAQITGHTAVPQWRDALDAIQQRHPLLSACIDTTFNRIPHFRRVTSQRIPLRMVASPVARWQQEIAEEAMRAISRLDAEVERAMQTGALKSVNKSYRAYRLEISARGESVLRYADWMERYKANLVRDIAANLRSL